MGSLGHLEASPDMQEASPDMQEASPDMQEASPDMQEASPDMQEAPARRPGPLLNLDVWRRELGAYRLAAAGVTGMSTRIDGSLPSTVLGI
jgi:hypothetical protein